MNKFIFKISTLTGEKKINLTLTPISVLQLPKLAFMIEHITDNIPKMIAIKKKMQMKNNTKTAQT